MKKNHHTEEHTQIIKHALSTEKSMKLIDTENRIIFAVERTSTKTQIKNAVEYMFKAKVINVNTTITPSGQKNAHVTFAKETPARNIATTLGLM